MSREQIACVVVVEINVNRNKMEIETRFKVDDSVWFMSMNRVSSGRVCAVRCKVEENGNMAVDYILGYIGDGIAKQEDELFESKGRLVDFLRHETEE